MESTNQAPGASPLGAEVRTDIVEVDAVDELIDGDEDLGFAIGGDRAHVVAGRDGDPRGEDGVGTVDVMEEVKLFHVRILSLGERGQRYAIPPIVIALSDGLPR